MSTAPHTAIAIFVKTPSLSPVKTRLAAGIGEEKAKEFYGLSLKAVEETTGKTEAATFWAVGEQEGLNDPLWSGFEAIYTGDGDLGERQDHIYETLLSKHDRVLLIGADLPQLSLEILQDAMTALDTHDFVIGPARDGGYYLFGGRVSMDKEIWTSIPWSTGITRERLESGMPSKPVHLPVLTDVDTQDDLKYVLQEMPDTGTPPQQKITDWIKSL